MSDLAALTPRERARLLARPEGRLGREIAEFWNTNNSLVTEAVYDRLCLTAGCSVLEIGFGNGRLLPLLMQKADAISYVGVDRSQTMVAEASAFNRALIDAGRAEYRLADAETMPYPDARFDRAFAVNVIYFWSDPVRVLREIHRVLRPDGLSIVAGADRTGVVNLAYARDEFGFHLRDAEELIAAHREAGFGRVDIEPFDDVAQRPDGSLYNRHYHLVIARL
jgi:SAM-dependent methyltransferase